MRKPSILAGAFCAALLCVSVGAQQAAPGDSGKKDVKGLSPRASAADYQSHAQAGTVTIAADLAGHGVPTADGVFENENYTIVEVGLFGPAGSHLNVSFKDFSLRVNGKKALIPAVPYESVFGALKDPEWVPPGGVQKESGNGVSTGGGNQSDPPAPVRMPMTLRLLMEQKVAKAALPEGDRALPGAGLLFFSQGGKTSNLRSVELVYSGAAGKATLPLQ